MHRRKQQILLLAGGSLLVLSVFSLVLGRYPMWGVLTPHQFLPDVIALRRQLIPDHERQTCLVGSLLNQDWLEQVNVREKALFIAAGVRQP